MIQLKYDDVIRISTPNRAYDYYVRSQHWYNSNSSNYYCIYEIAPDTSSAGGMTRFASKCYGYETDWGVNDFPPYRDGDYAAATRLLKGIYEACMDKWGKNNFYIHVNGQDWKPVEDGSLDPKFFKLKRQPIKLKTSL